MKKYLIQISFTADSFASLVKKPENRLESVIPMVNAMGGSFVGSWLSLGQYDSTAVIEMPNDISMEAFKMAVMAGGGLTRFDLTPLMSFEDGVQAMELAQKVRYTPFSGKESSSDKQV